MPLAVAAIVTLSAPALVVNVTFDPATSVKVSAAASATTSDSPETAIVLNASPPPPAAANVIVSPLVVSVILPPATNVNVSVVVSATTSVCPEIAIVLNEEHPPHIAFKVKSSLSFPCSVDEIKLHRDNSSYYYGSDPDGNIIEWIVYAEDSE